MNFYGLDFNIFSNITKLLSGEVLMIFARISKVAWNNFNYKNIIMNYRIKSMPFIKLNSNDNPLKYYILWEYRVRQIIWCDNPKEILSVTNFVYSNRDIVKSYENYHLSNKSHLHFILSDDLDENTINYIDDSDKIEDHILVKLHNILKDLRVNLIRGDVIQLSWCTYRNDGLFIYDGENIIDLVYDKFDDYGHIPKSFTIPEFPIYYWSEIIQHNCCMWINPKYHQELIDNVTDNDNTGFISAIPHTYFMDSITNKLFYIYYDDICKLDEFKMKIIENIKKDYPFAWNSNGKIQLTGFGYIAMESRWFK